MFGALAPLPLRLVAHKDTVSAGQHAAAARDVQAFRTVDFAVLRFTAGTADSLSCFTSTLGIGLQYRPAISTSGTGVGIATFLAGYQDAMDGWALTKIIGVDAQAGGATAAVATPEITSPTSVTVRRTNVSGTAVSGEVTLTLTGRFEPRRIGHYGAALDKKDTVTEQVPFAYWYYRELQAGRGSAFQRRTDNLYVHGENFAIARACAFQHRQSEALSANSTARTAFARLPRYQRDFALPYREGETTQELRQRAAAFEEAPRRNDRAIIEGQLETLLGRLLVKVWWFDQSTALSASPTPTFWPGVNPGPTAYDLGGGAWMSARAHVVVEVLPPSDVELRRYLELLNGDMFRLLSDRLPDDMTFDWSVGLSAEDGQAGDGFLLDISDMDFVGMT